MKNLIFIGMPAVGKSTVGVVTAKRLGYHFIDVDILIQEKEGKLLKEIIREQAFPDSWKWRTGSTRNWRRTMRS